MRQILRAIVFAAALLLPGIAHSQCAFTSPIPANTVVGRLGIGPGPCQAIPINQLGLSAVIGNSFTQFTGPLAPTKTFTLPNASGTIATTNQSQVWTSAQTFLVAPTFSGANFLTNSNLAQMPANTVKCNPTGSTANAQDCTSQVISGTYTSNGFGNGPTSGFLTSSASAAYGWQVVGQPVDQKVWDAVGQGTSLSFRAVNDAGSAANSWMTVTRGAGATVSSVSIPNLTGVANSNLATMPAGTAKCNPTASAAAPQDCNIGYLNVVSLGADPTGAVDSATVFQSAFTSAQSGGSVFIPCGTYKLSTIITASIPANKAMSILGGGRGCAKLNFFNNTNGLSFNYANSTSSLTVQGLSILAGGAGGTTGLGITATAYTNSALAPISTFRDLEFHGNDGYGVTNFWNFGILVFNAGISNVNIDGVLVAGDSTQTHGVGIQVQGTASQIPVVYNIANSVFVQLNIGFVYGTFLQGVAITNCNFTGSAQGINVPASGSGLTQLTVTGSQFGTSQTIIGSVITGVSFVNNYFIMAANQAAIQGTPAKFQIIGNTFASSSTTGSEAFVAASGATQGVISGNSFSGFNTPIVLQAGSSNINVLGNVYTGNTNGNSNAGTGNTLGVATQ